MTKMLKKYLFEFLLTEVGASEKSIDELQCQICMEFPGDYFEFMRQFNGGEGEVGPNSWLCLYPIEELTSFNSDYSLLMEQIPDYFLFGKDAADTGYAFHKFNRTIHSFGLMSEFKTDSIEDCGNSFEAFLAYLYHM